MTMASKFRLFATAASKGPGHLIWQLRFKVAHKFLGKNWTAFSHVSVPVQPIHTQTQKKIFLAITCIIRNESDGIEEWLNFHISAGVEHFYIYDNESTDNIDQILMPYVRSGHVTLVKWPTAFYRSTQVFAYAHSVNLNRNNVEWMAFIDADEFIFPAIKKTIPEVCIDSPITNAFHIKWTCFGGSNFQTPPMDGVLKSYTRKVDLRNADSSMIYEFTKIKSLVRISSLREIKVHDSVVDGLTETDPNFLKINHYLFKSEKDFQAKLENSWEKYDAKSTWMRKRLRMKSFIDAHNVEDLEILSYLSSMKKEREEDGN
jgi:hypothetical protein